MRALSILWKIAACGAIVFVTMNLPGPLLLHVAHRLPAWLEPRAVVVSAQAGALALVFLALRVSPTSLSGSPSRAGFGAAGWFVLATSALSALVSLMLIAGGSGDARSEVDALLATWQREFPATGLAARFAVLALLIPVVEEFLFRGLVLGRLLGAAPAWLGLAVSTALFAQGHASWVLAGLTGAGFGLLYLRYRNLWVCVVAHGAHNLVSAAGIPLLAAHLRDAGAVVRGSGAMLPLQFVVFALFLACTALFLRSVFGRIEGGPSSLLRRPVGAAADAPT